MKKSVKKIGICLSMIFVITLVSSFFIQAEELTPAEFLGLSTKGKLEYKTVKIWEAGPNIGMIGSVLEKETYENFDELMDTGNSYLAMIMYNLTLFQLAHPKVEVKGISFGFWGEHGLENLLTSLAGGVEGSVGSYPLHAAGTPAVYIDEGLVADITDVFEEGDYLKYIDTSNSNVMANWKTAQKDGRIYGIPTSGAGGKFVKFRKDFFKEAGIFNEKGEPGPPVSWTWQDLREMAKKLTDVKKQRWGVALGVKGATTRGALSYFYAYLFSRGLSGYHAFQIPDKSGKYTWRFANIPELRDALQFLRDWKFEDKSVLTGIEYTAGNSRNDVNAGRAAMNLHCQWNWLLGIYKQKPYLFDPEIPSTEFLGFATNPKDGQYGLRFNPGGWGINGFNPLYDKEQLKAELDWYEWLHSGEGRRLLVEEGNQRIKLGVPQMWQYIFMLPGAPGIAWKFQGSVPRGTPTWEEFAPKEVREVIAYNDQIPICEQLCMDSGFLGKGYTDFFFVVNNLLGSILTDPNTTVQEAMDKAEEVANAGPFKMKLKDSEENLKTFYEGLDTFYKEYYPEFYQNKWQELYENYYRLD